jgi:hypothetical protein
MWRFSLDGSRKNVDRNQQGTNGDQCPRMAISPLDRILKERRGRIDALLGTANGDLFAGSYGGGVFRSSDNGDNWIQVSDRLIARFVLSFMRSSSGHIFAGTCLAAGFLSNRQWRLVNPGKHRFGLRQHLASRHQSGRHYLCRNSRM